MKNYALGVGMLLFVLSCSEDKKIVPAPIIVPSSTGSVMLVFEPYVDSIPLVLYTSKYLSPANDTFQVQNFKFFVHFQSLQSDSALLKATDSYSLISFDSETIQNTILLDSIPVGNYSNLKFDIGIDSANNHSTVHLGELAPGSGMTWDWNTGYKFLLMEGTFSTLTKNGPLVFHVGSDKNYKALSFDLPSVLKVEKGKTTQIKIKTNVNGLFRSPNLIDFDVIHQAMGSPETDKIADNYAKGMFSVVQIINQ